MKAYAETKNQFESTLYEVKNNIEDQEFIKAASPQEIEEITTIRDE